MINDEFICGENLAQKCDFIFAQTKSKNGMPNFYIAETLPKLSDGNIIFCKTDYIYLLKNCLENFSLNDLKLNIITHDSDYSLTDDIISSFNNKNLSWWGINCESQNANSIPIGIANSYCNITLKKFKKSIAPKKLLYINHRISTYPQIREPLYNKFLNKTWATTRNPESIKTIEEYQDELIDHKFILCPRGNGIDTHRMWEALYSNVIPVVIRHKTHDNLENNLPILFLNSYDELNEDLLNKTYEKYNSIKWNCEMLNASWWINKIKKKNEN